MTDWINVRVAGVKGSAPRNVGAVMQVFNTSTTGSIGGGALEFQAIQQARKMLTTGKVLEPQRIALGPELGQCCGGQVTLEFQRHSRREAPDNQFSAPPLWIWGAGHVGQAIAQTIAPLHDRAITVIDTSPERMPGNLPAHVSPLIALDPVRVVPRAPKSAEHVIVTYSHKIDLALCDALLHNGFAYCGLIGSATKWSRFRSRLASMGHQDSEISKIICPIGDPKLGKHPQAIAVGLVAALLSPQRQGGT